jgi:hypothetical protein
MFRGVIKVVQREWWQYTQRSDNHTQGSEPTQLQTALGDAVLMFVQCSDSYSHQMHSSCIQTLLST